MKTFARMFSGCVLVLFAADVVVAQDTRLGRRLDPVTANAVSAIVDSSRVVGLPTEPLVQKALEGASKGASSERVVAAVRALALRLREARQALETTNASELVAAATALAAGARPEDLRKWRGHASGERLIPLIGWTYLMQHGVDSDGALRIVQAMMDAKLSGADFVMLQRLVDQDVRAGAPPAEAARLRANSLILQRSRLPDEWGES